MVGDRFNDAETIIQLTLPRQTVRIKKIKMHKSNETIPINSKTKPIPPSPLPHPLSAWNLLLHCHAPCTVTRSFQSANHIITLKVQTENIQAFLYKGQIVRCIFYLHLSIVGVKRAFDQSARSRNVRLVEFKIQLTTSIQASSWNHIGSYGIMGHSTRFREERSKPIAEKHNCKRPFMNVSKHWARKTAANASRAAFNKLAKTEHFLLSQQAQARVKDAWGTKNRALNRYLSTAKSDRSAPTEGIRQGCGGGNSPRLSADLSGSLMSELRR